MVVRGRNSLVVTAADSGLWVISAEIARRRSLDEVGAQGWGLRLNWMDGVGVPGWDDMLKG